MGDEIDQDDVTVIDERSLSVAARFQGAHPSSGRVLVVIGAAGVQFTSGSADPFTLSLTAWQAIVALALQRNP